MLESPGTLEGTQMTTEQKSEIVANLTKCVEDVTRLSVSIRKRAQTHIDDQETLLVLLERLKAIGEKLDPAQSDDYPYWAPIVSEPS